MRKRPLYKIFAILLALTVLMGIPAPSFAADLDGRPSVFVSGDGVYEIDAAKETRLTIQVKNKGGALAESIVMRAKSDEAIPPFKINFSAGENVGNLGANGVKSLNMYVEITGTVEKASYPITISYTYQDAAGSSYSGSDTIYLRMKGFNTEPDYTFDQMKLAPESMSPGTAATLSGIVKNTGSQDMYMTEVSLSNLSTEGITISGGFNTVQVGKLTVGQTASFSFQLASSADMVAGNYPVTIQLKYQDAYGKEFTKEQQYYVNVGGASGKTSQLEIRNMKEPQGVYGVNQNFPVQFELYNAGQVAAKDIVITAEALDPTAVVPKSSSVKTLSSLAPGASMPLNFTFAGTNQATSQNYAIQFLVEYTSGGTKVHSFKQYAGANISNPEKDKEGEEENPSKPKIIVSNYVCDPLIVMAGQEFDLNLTLTNTHAAKGVKNIKMFLTLAEETSSETEKSGNIFTPVNSSNTFYFDAIAPKGSVDKDLRLYVVPNAQPKTYTLTVNFEYEDAEGKEYTAKELLGINVEQETELSIDEFALPETIEQYTPVTVSFSYYNTGKVALSNLMFKVEGDVECSQKSTYIGNLDSGASDYYEVSFTPNNLGQVPVDIVAVYEDPSGETQEIRRSFVLNVTEPIMMDGEMDGEQPETTLNIKNVGIAIAVLLVLAAGLFFFIKKQKEDPDAFAESMENDEDLDEDLLEEDEDDKDEEGMPL